MVPRIADACGASEPQLTNSVPVDGATHPANAALLFSGFEISLDTVTVTVDDVPAAFVPAEFAAGFADIAVLVEPAPQPGQQVVVSGAFCVGAETCAPVSISYTAGEPDLVAPAPIAADSFIAIYDHVDYNAPNGCDEVTVVQTLYAHVKQEAPAAGAALDVFHIEWDPDEAGPLGFRQNRRVDADAFVAGIPLRADMIADTDLVADACVDVVAVDLAGNAAPAFQLCPPCFVRSDENPVDGSPVEPAWSDADAVPGSVCAPATETSGDVTDTDTGEVPGTTGGDSETGSPTSGPDDPTSAGTSGGESQSSGEEPGSTGSASGGEDDGDKGCACDSTGGGLSDLGRLLMLSLGVMLGRRRRR